MFPKTQSTKAQLKKISDEIDQDPNPLKNLGTYSTPMMEREAFKIMCKSINKNLVDSSAYTHIGKHKDELLKMISHLLHGKDVRGEITSGSSESIYIAMMAHKLKWIEKHGQPTKKLNFVVGIHTHNTFEKFAKFFDVEMRSIPLNSKHSIDTSVVEEYIDDHTICVVGIACSTELAVTDNLKALDSIARKHRIPLHIDGASGAFYLPFVAPDFKFDFRLKSVESINISGHKFGLTFPGVGCILIKNTAIPKELFSEINYLASGELKHINLLCTQNAAFMEGWHYTIKNLGFNGYRRVLKSLQRHSIFLKNKLSSIEGIQVVNSEGIYPVVTFTSDRYNLKILSGHLYEKGWVQSPYKVKGTDVETIRVVLKIGMDRGLITQFIDDLKTIIGGDQDNKILSTVKTEIRGENEGVLSIF